MNYTVEHFLDYMAYKNRHHELNRIYKLNDPPGCPMKTMNFEGYVKYIHPNIPGFRSKL